MTTIKLSTVNIEERKAMTFKAGDVVKVDTKVKEGANKDGTPKFRTQAYEGLVLARKHGAEPGATFTVRKMSGTIAVERIFPLYSPAIENITLIRANKTRRSKLYFVRTKAAKETRKKLTEIKKKTIKGVLDAKIEAKKATKQAVAA